MGRGIYLIFHPGGMSTTVWTIASCKEILLIDLAMGGCTEGPRISGNLCLDAESVYQANP